MPASRVVCRASRRARWSTGSQNLPMLYTSYLVAYYQILVLSVSDPILDGKEAGLTAR